MTGAGEEILAVFTVFDHFDSNDSATNYWYPVGFFADRTIDASPVFVDELAAAQDEAVIQGSE